MSPISSRTTQPEERNPLAQLDALPGPLRTFLLSRSASEDLRVIYKKYQFPTNTLDAIVDLIGDIDFGYLPFSELLLALVDDVGLPEAQAKQFAIDLAGLRYLPVAELLGANVREAIKSWGGDPKKFPVKKVEAQKMTAQMLVRDLLASSKEPLDTRLKERLQFVLLSRISGVRDDTETRDILTRSQKVGGVELAATQAEELLDQLKRKLASAQIVAEMPAAPPSSTVPSTQNLVPSTPPRPAPRAAPSATVAPKPRPSLSEALPAAQKFAGPDFQIPEAKPQKDEEEIESMRAKLAERIPKESELAARKRTASVESTVRTSGLTLDPALTERFKRIVDARLRDIRDALETKRLLAQSMETGGLALSAGVASRVTNLMEAEYRALTGQGAADKQREARALESTIQQAAEAREAMRTASAAQAAEARFYKIAEKSQKLQEQEVLLPSTTPTIQPPTSDLQRPTSNVGKKPILKAILSQASVTTPPESKPKMEDVKVVRTVSGPIDELAAMTIVEFRRLSKDPREATLKIRDKIELLKEEGFDRYLAAVRAWQSSLPNRAYLALTREALGSNTTVPALIREKTQATQPTLTLDEFHAILALNSQLQL